MNKAALGNFLAELREEKGLTQEQLADYLDINYKTVSKWECGNSLPNLETIDKLSKLYDVSLYEFSIYRKLNNPLISKENIKKIITCDDVKKILVRKSIILALLFLFIISSIITHIYTINNYNKMAVYELVSNNKDIEVKGMYVVDHDDCYIAINNIDEHNYNRLHENIKLFQFELLINDSIIEKNDINFQSPKSISEIYESTQIYTKLKQSEKKINNIVLKLNYETQNNVIFSQHINIKLVKR